MPPRDLRDWIELLERNEELVRVGAEVDPHLEITEIVDRVVKSGGPALLPSYAVIRSAGRPNAFATTSAIGLRSMFVSPVDPGAVCRGR